MTPVGARRATRILDDFCSVLGQDVVHDTRSNDVRVRLVVDGQTLGSFSSAGWAAAWLLEHWY